MEKLTSDEAQIAYKFLDRVSPQGITESKQMAALAIKMEAIATGRELPRAPIEPPDEE